MSVLTRHHCSACNLDFDRFAPPDSVPICRRCQRADTVTPLPLGSTRSSPSCSGGSCNDCSGSAGRLPACRLRFLGRRT